MVTQQLPGPAALRIPTLQAHHLLAGGGLERFILIKAGLGLAIERHQIAKIHGISRGEGLRCHLLEVGDQHAELGTPVAHVIEAQHRMAAEGQNASQGIANDGGAQMAHMHLLGDVGAGEIHDHRQPLWSLGHPQARIAHAQAHLLGQHLRAQGEVKKTGTGDLGRLAEGVEG